MSTVNKLQILDSNSGKNVGDTSSFFEYDWSF